MEPRHFLKVHLPRQESEQSCMCVCEGIDYASVSTILLLVGTVPTLWVFFLFFISKLHIFSTKYTTYYYYYYYYYQTKTSFLV